MNTIAVAGGTGVVGRRVVAALRERGVQVRVLSRLTGFDLLTGVGLDQALDGVTAVVDVANTSTTNARRSIAFFEATTTNLLSAERRAGVDHHLTLSIVGSDHVALGYYAGKRRQEQLVRASNVPWTILRATQFHEFAARVTDRRRGPVVVVPRMRIQPVAAAEVGDMLATLALDGPVGIAWELAGPEVHDLPDLVRRLLRGRESHRLALPVRMPGEVGRGLAGGALLPRGDGPRGRQTWGSWLAGLVADEQAGAEVARA